MPEVTADHNGEAGHVMVRKKHARREGTGHKREIQRLHTMRV